MPLASMPLPGNSLGGRHFEHRIPVVRRIDLRGLGRRRRQRRLQRDVLLPRLGRDRLRVDEAVAADPHVVGDVRQLRQREAAVVGRDDDLVEARRRFRRLSDDPDAGFASLGALDDAGDRALRRSQDRLLSPYGNGDAGRRRRGEAQRHCEARVRLDRRSDDAIIGLLLVRITRFRYSTYSCEADDIVRESRRAVKDSRVKLLPMNDRFQPDRSGVSRRAFLNTTLAGAAFMPALHQQPAPRRRRRRSSRATGPAARPIRYPDPDIDRARQPVPPLHRRQHDDPPAPHRDAVGGRAGMERRRPLPRLERHPQQRPDALDRRRRPGDGVPQSVRLQQRQHLRPRRPSAVVRARRPPRRALRTVR